MRELLVNVLAAGYGRATEVRARLYARGICEQQTLGVPVISVGNLSVGGTGKTPLAAWLAQSLERKGARVAIVSRGYGRTSRGLRVVADFEGLRLADPAAAGDEPWMLAGECPGVAVVVAEDRVRGGRHAVERLGADVLVLDDGYQHLRLARALDIVILDAGVSLRQAALLPKGRLREPLAALSRADLVVLREPEDAPGTLSGSELRGLVRPGTPFIQMRQRFTGLKSASGVAEPIASLSGARVFALSGIANPARFEADLARLGAVLLGARRFRDHHAFREHELESVAAEARKLRVDRIVTTCKDLARLGREGLAGMPLTALVREPWIVQQEELEARLFAAARLDAARDGASA